MDSAARPCDDARMTRTRWIQVALALAGAALGVLAYRIQIDNLPNTTVLRSCGSVAAAWSFLVAGLVAWMRRPKNRLGPLMVATCFALLARQFRYSHDELAFTAFFLLGELGYALFTHVALRVPVRPSVGPARASVSLGRVRRRDRVSRSRSCSSTKERSGSATSIRSRARTCCWSPIAHESSTSSRTRSGVVAYGVLGTTFVVLVLRKFVRASPRARRVYLPLLVAALAAALWAVLNGILTFATAPPEIVHDLFWWQIASLIALPLAMLWGLLRARLARVHVGELVVHLEETPVDGLRDELAVALEDPTLELGLWIPDRGIYVDAAGGELPVPEDGAERAVTLIEHEGAPLAVLVHDPTLQRGAEARRGRCCGGPARARQRSPARRGARAARDGAGVAGADRRRRGRGAPTDRARSARRRAAAARRARARAAQRAAAARGVGRPGARASALLDRGRAPGRGRGATRPRAGHPPGDPHAGRARPRARGAGSAGAAPGDGGRDPGAVLARGRGDCVLRRLRGAHERREARRRIEGVDRREAGQRPPRDRGRGRRCRRRRAETADPACAGCRIASRRVAAASSSRASRAPEPAFEGSSRARRDRRGLRAPARGPRARADRRRVRGRQRRPATRTS